MSRILGRTYDIYNISKYLIDNYSKQYVFNKRQISDDEFFDATRVISPYLGEKELNYLEQCNVQYGYNIFIKDTTYSNYGEENIIIFPTKNLHESYKRDMIYFLGELLKRNSLDYTPQDYDISCQFSNVLPYLLEYLFLRDTNKEIDFSTRHLDGLLLNSKIYKNIFECYRDDEKFMKEERFLEQSLIFLVSLSSLDATLQISDEIAKDKIELQKLIHELFENKNHNREEILADRNITTYGFKRLMKEIDLRG